MPKRLWMVFVLVLMGLPMEASGQMARVMVFPFEINASEEFANLQTQIPEVLNRYLQQDGAIALTPEVAQVQTVQEYKNAGIAAGADYLIWGSFTLIGQRFSLDGRLLQTLSDEPPSAHFVEGEGIENLVSALKKLSDEMGLKIFQRSRVARVEVSGNNRIESDAILRVVQTKAEDIFSPEKLSSDLKSIYKMGYFDDVRVESEDEEEGKIVIFKVVEKPTIRHIRFKGNRVYDDEELKNNLDIKTGSILNIYKVQNNIARLEDLYKDKNYHNANVTYEMRPLERNQADLEFVINEGDKVQIKEINFVGNSAYSDKDLKKIMKTSEKGFFSILTRSGELDTEDLAQDISRLGAFYQNNGYINAKVSDPAIEFKDEWIYITIKVDEGPRFKVGQVEVVGDLVLPQEELLKRIKLNKETYYNREVVRNDVLALTDLYSDEGYAYAEITPSIDTKQQEQVVDITYGIQKGEQVYFEKIIIGGNTKTRDKVIRRELKVYEQDLYSGRRLKSGVRNLIRLDYFEDVKVNTAKGSADDKMILNIDVVEKPTGTFSFGGGYSSIDNFFVMGSISQRNLFGRGQRLELKAQLGGSSTRYTLSFTEPWLFDIPLSAGIDLFNWELEYNDYDKKSTGGTLRLGYPVYAYTRAFVSYTLSQENITKVSSSASDQIKDLEGNNITSKIGTSLVYDSRDKLFLTTQGMKHALDLTYAGGPLGGDFAFTKVVGQASVYFPIVWEFVGLLNTEAGWVTENSGGDLPDFERFYLGGINSLRGFKWRDISAKDNDGNDIGGKTFVQGNAELLFPMAKEAGVMGVLFVDSGDVYGNNENIDLSDLKVSAGGGIRWLSPFGPIRLEYGWVLVPEEGERKKGKWEFSMGSSF